MDASAREVFYFHSSPSGETKAGAVVGKNRVVVNYPMRERGNDLEAPPPRPAGAIPVRYTVAAKTPLEVEVKPGGPQVINLPLTK